jgi:hypothetical protein
MAPDQRYCLRCGHRRGDPRLPFMDAVVFMDTVKRPSAEEVAAASPPPSSSESKGSGISAQTTLIAGIATLVLAVGVGVLIGRSGNNSAPVAASPTKVIKIGGTESGGGEEVETGTGDEAGGKEATKKSAKGSKSAQKKSGKVKEKNGAPELETGASGASKASEEVLKPSADAKPLPPPTTKVGETCKKGTAGCSESGEFNGSFFGE